MGRDNQPKARQKKQLARKVGKRAGYDRILIVSEGSKTEPNYFREIRSKYHLHTANVAVWHCEIGTLPIQVVEYAKRLFVDGDPQKSIQPRAFEKVYAVFDRDDHERYFDALRFAESIDGQLRNDTRKMVHFRAIASVPSFELWLLLHFEEIHAPLHRDEVMRRLKRHLPDYEKGSSGIFSATDERLPAAFQKADQLAARNTAYSAPKPFTAVVDLVRLLTTLRD